MLHIKKIGFLFSSLVLLKCTFGTLDDFNCLCTRKCHYNFWRFFCGSLCRSSLSISYRTIFYKSFFFACLVEFLSFFSVLRARRFGCSFFELEICHPMKKTNKSTRVAFTFNAVQTIKMTELSVHAITTHPPCTEFDEVFVWQKVWQTNTVQMKINGTNRL